MTTVLPAWASWNVAGRERPFSVGVEEEVMLVDPADWNLAARVDDVLAAADGSALRSHLSRETHGSAVELHTAPHTDAGGALRQLAGLRAGLRATLDPLGLVPAAAGTHPFASGRDADMPTSERQQELCATMRDLARRAPTFALHVHVAIPDAEEAIRAMNRMRAHVPLLLALSANSPYWHGRDSGLASARTPLFQAFPRSGLPRYFEDYEALVAAIGLLIGSGAIPEPSFIWWDVRLQPRYGTLEVRVMDAQTSLARTRALVELVRALAAAECESDGLACPTLVASHEVLDENRFRALRDGVDATFVDPASGGLVPVADVLAAAVEACGGIPGAQALLEDPGAAIQRAAGRDGPEAVVQDLVARF